MTRPTFAQEPIEPMKEEKHLAVPQKSSPLQLKETTGGEFRVYRASIRYIDLL